MPSIREQRTTVPSRGTSSRSSGRIRDDLVSRAVRDHLDVMLAAARRVLPSDDLAWDAVQESLQALWKEGAINTPLRGWLLRAVRLRAFHLLRSERRRRQHEAACACLCCLVAYDDPARRMENRELLNLAVKAIERLPPAYRSVVEMRDWLDMDYASIALELGVPVGTIRSRLSRARDQVRAALRPALRQGRRSGAGGRPVACLA